MNIDWSNWIKIISLIIQYGPKVASAINEFSHPLPASGHKGIAWVQWVLNEFEGEHLVIDGILGPATQAAVKRVQEKLGIASDGIPGMLTQLALGALAKL